MAVDDKAAADLQRRVNRWASRIVPAFLIGLAGYVTWAVVVLLAVNRLIHPPQDVQKNTAAGIVIIVLYFLFLLLVAVVYARILAIITINPGVVPRPSDAPPASSNSSRRTRRREQDAEKAVPSSAESSEPGLDPSRLRGYLDRSAVLDGREPPPPGLDEFAARNVYECDIDGLPRWCPTCHAWKPDRSHHSSELGRCVYKMDHYCPWAGGVVAEKNFKFFVQFCVYGALYTLFVLIVTSYYYAKLHGEVRDVYKVNWIVTIVLAALFFCFNFAMAANSIKFVLNNTGTIDSLSRSSRAYNFAVLIPPPVLRELNARRRTPAVREGSHPDPLGEANLPFYTITYPLGSLASQEPNQRVFAILQIPSTQNPYKLESSAANFREVFGYNILDWLLPISPSPCSQHSQFGASADGGEAAWSMYPTGPVVEKMIEDAGLADNSHAQQGQNRQKRTRKSDGRRQSVREYHEDKRRRNERDGTTVEESASNGA